MMQRKYPSLSHTTIVFLVALPFVVLNYILFILNPANRGDLGIYILQLIADLISLGVIVGLWMTILIDMLGGDTHTQNTARPSKKILEQNPQVDVLIPVAGEDIEIIRQTVLAAKEMDYPHNTFILDDKDSDQVKQLSKDLGVFYLRREGNDYAKAGNINHALLYSQADFIAILDADFIASREFLVDLLPWMSDSRVAFVQSPQHYTNTHNFIARGTAGSQEIFYRYVLPARNSSNSVFCVGTNVVFRRKALDEVGGIALMDHSEDIWTSLHIHSKGWKSVFVGKVLAKGQAPETIKAFFKQQKRWAQGGFSLLFDHNPLFEKELSPDQKIQYFFTTTFYFIGFAILIYMILPILYLLFGLSPIEPDNPGLWLIRFIPYFLLVYIIPLSLVKKFHTSIIGTSLVSFYPYIQGLIAALIKRKYIWIATTSTKNRNQESLLPYLWPHISILCISTVSLIMAWTMQEPSINTVINSFWVMVNMLFILEFIIHAERKVPSYSKAKLMYNPN